MTNDGATMYKNGMMMAEICRRLSISKHVLREQMKAANVKPRNHKDRFVVTFESEVIELFSSATLCKETGCFNWDKAKNRKGYGMTHFCKERMMAHRAAYVVVNCAIPDGMYICHKCDNPSCINPDHLYAGTQKQNMRDMVERNRWGGNPPTGESHHRTTLLEDQVVEIIEMRKSGMTYQSIADHFGVSRKTASNICTGLTWSSVTQSQKEKP